MVPIITCLPYDISGSSNPSGYSMLKALSIQAEACRATQVIPLKRINQCHLIFDKYAIGSPSQYMKKKKKKNREPRGLEIQELQAPLYVVDLSCVHPLGPTQYPMHPELA